MKKHITNFQFNYLLYRIFTVIALLYLFINTSIAAPIDYRDNEIKAAYLYKLLYFVEWPEVENKQDRINICVLGNNIFKSIRDDIEDQSFQDKRVRLVEVSRNEINPQKCQIVFISDSEAANFRNIISEIKSAPILVVSDIPQFAKSGGMVGLTNFNNSIQIEINLGSLSGAKFKIDPNLLEVALNVYE